MFASFWSSDLGTEVRRKSLRLQEEVSQASGLSPGHYTFKQQASAFRTGTNNLLQPIYFKSPRTSDQYNQFYMS